MVVLDILEEHRLSEHVESSHGSEKQNKNVANIWIAISVAVSMRNLLLGKA